jgi:hypothetical protein
VTAGLDPLLDLAVRGLRAQAAVDALTRPEASEASSGSPPEAPAPLAGLPGPARGTSTYDCPTAEETKHD